MKEKVKKSELKNLLIKKGISPSVQRLKTLEYLYKNRTHPSVDMIYDDLKNEIPTLSKTTIYNVLRRFVKEGIVKEITIEGSEVRFDIYIEPHAHFKCEKCGKIYDIKYENQAFYLKEIDGNQIKNTEIFFYGICKDCLNK
ncbi:MAG: Fur family transcriptional regulator [Caldisericia bacterium]|jgi:Fe2+ or Zn2+ uptake regulation protein|nr:Fur family transcriptional regulator [Caldisericia bacterium]